MTTSDPITTGSRPTSVSREWLPTAIVLVAYGLLMLVTRTLDQGDTSVYGDDLVHRARGELATMWEFGHALWRPLAYSLFRLMHLDVSGATYGALFEDAVRVLTGLSVLGGAVAVVALRSWLERLGVSRTAALGATIAFAAASAFLSYAQTGSSYIPALAMLIIGLREIAAEDRQSDRRTIVVTSIAFALAVLLWFPMVLAVPAAALSMLLLRGSSPRRWRVAITVCVVSGLITIAAYVPIAALAGVRSVADFREWMAQATHDIRGIGGLQRAIVGFGRSLVNMDRLGLVAKRHLIGDPYNPASMADVARAGLLRLGILYALLGVMVVVLARRAPGRRALAFLAATALPVVGFALKWQGGDLERYLGMFPALFFAVALVVSMFAGRAQVAAAAAVALLLIVVNVPAISRSKSDRACATLSARLGSVPRSDGRPTVMLTPHELDEISTYRNRCPSAPLLKVQNPPQAFGLVMANNEKAVAWRDTLASRASRAWAQGGHVWIARRAFVESPPEAWKWAEGDDRRLHWRDFPEFFRALDVGPSVGGEDGFVEVLPTPKTRAAIERLRKRPTS
jgi:hypothetical protein